MGVDSTARPSEPYTVDNDPEYVLACCYESPQ